MTRISNRITGLLLALLLLISILPMNTQAAGGLSISSSASKVEENGTFTVTVKASSGYFVADISLSVSGGTIVSNLGKASLDDGESATAKIKLTGDKCVVSVSGTAANYETETEGSASASVTVKKKEPATTAQKPDTTTAKKPDTTTAKKPEATTATEEPAKSGDNNLSSLTVSEGTLSPSFSAGTTSYKVELPKTATEITLNAKAHHEKATLSGTGKKTLSVGSNTFTITCKAEDGSTKKI